MDWSLSEADFAASATIMSLVMNAGQHRAVTELVRVEDAIAHFERTLAANGLSTASIVGTWLSTTEDDLLAVVFLADGTYVHAKVDLDNQTEPSGMEWGTYARDGGSGITTFSQTFDGNGGTGLSDL